MFKIGEFSRFSRVSVKMLRHYDEIGLLSPAHVDPESGYRYYTADQLPRLNQIIALKDLGFRLEQIARLLDEDLSGDELMGILKLKRSEIEARIDAEKRRLARVELSLRHIIRKDRLPEYVVILREVASQLMASIRVTVPDMSGVSTLFDEVEAHAAQYGARSISPPLMLLHDTEYRNEQIEIEVAVPVTRDIPGTERIRVYELPGADEMACIVYTGGYASTDLLIGEYPPWMEANGYEASGPLREVYLRFGAANVGYTLPETYLTTLPDAFVTELQLPVRKVGAR